jgi:hypothetical protein
MIYHGIKDKESGIQVHSGEWSNPIRRMVQSNQTNGPIQSSVWSNSIKRMAKLKMRQNTLSKRKEYSACD